MWWPRCHFTTVTWHDSSAVLRQTDLKGTCNMQLCRSSQSCQQHCIPMWQSWMMVVGPMHVPHGMMVRAVLSSIPHRSITPSLLCSTCDPTSSIWKRCVPALPSLAIHLGHGGLRTYVRRIKAQHAGVHACILFGHSANVSHTL